MTIPDEKGNLYTENFLQLRSVFSGSTSILIKAEAISIFGLSSENNAFYNCRDTITSVTFESGSKLTSIQDYAFYQCKKINSLDFSVCTELKTIGKQSFAYTSGLKTINLPQSLSLIGQYSFWHSGFTEILIPKGVTTLENGAFAACQSLINVSFEDGINLEEIHEYTFEYSGIVSLTLPKSLRKFTALSLRPAAMLKNITIEANDYFKVNEGFLCSKNGDDLVVCPASLSTETITIPDNIKTIKSHSFFVCKAKKVILTNKVEKIETQAFMESKIQSFEFPESLTTLSDEVFCKCRDLQSVTLTNSITKLPTKLFYNTGLLSISLPESITEIGSLCFGVCVGLKDVILPSQLDKFGGGAFSGCPNINLTFAPGSPFMIEDFLIMSTDKLNVFQYIGSTEGVELTLPNTVKVIKTGAFLENKNIKKVKFEGVSSLTTIETYAFKTCSNLISFDFPDSLETIQREAFIGTALQSANFGTSLKVISNDAFTRCTTLTTVRFDATKNDLVLNPSCFDQCSFLNTVVFADGLSIIYKRAFALTTALQEITLPASLTAIHDEAFSESGVQTVLFSAEQVNLKTIGTKAFYKAKSLSRFQFVEGIEVLGTLAFSETALSSIVIPLSVTTIDLMCFKSCVSITDISLVSSEANLSEIGDGAFENCFRLKDINCNNTFFTTLNGALYTADLTNIIIFPPASPSMFVCLPFKVAIIAPSAFYMCKNIYSIMIPDDSQLKIIGAYSFAGCSRLRTINIPDCVETIGLNAFIDCKQLSCGLVIGNTTKEYTDNLVQNAKMPKRCLESCVFCPSLQYRRNTAFTLSCFAFILLIDCDTK